MGGRLYVRFVKVGNVALVFLLIYVSGSLWSRSNIACNRICDEKGRLYNTGTRAHCTEKGCIAAAVGEVMAGRSVSARTCQA